MNTFMMLQFRYRHEGRQHAFGNDLFNRSFVENMNYIHAAIAFTAFAVLLILFSGLFPRFHKKAPIVLFISGWLYFFLLIFATRPNIYTAIGSLAVMAALAIYAASKNGGFPGLTSNKLRIILFILFAFIVWFIGTATVYRYWTFSSPAFDFGIFTQMFEYMRTEGVPYTTVERDRLLSHFSVHLSPAFYLILPVYMLFPDPATIQIMQAVVVAAGIFPLYLICRIKKVRNIATLFILIMYSFYPALSGSCMYDIHENMFLTAFVLWTLYFLEKTDKTRLAWIGVFVFALLTFSVKEDAPIYIAVIALYAIFGRKKVYWGSALFLFACIYLIFALWYLDTFGLGIMAGSRYGLYAEDGSIVGVIKSIILNPGFMVKEMFIGPHDHPHTKLLYLLRILLPLSFLPFVSKKSANLILLIPCILINLLPTWVYHHDIGFQYHFGTTALFFYLFVINFSSLKNLKIKKAILLFSMTASIFLFTTEMWGRIDIRDRFYDNEDNLLIMHSVLADVPTDRSVAASTFFVPHLFRVKELYELHGHKDHQEDLIVVDIRGSYELKETYLQRGYTVMTYRANLIVVLERPK
jgi:uncharacterized membrane protein